jgi:hypothetical protein
MHSNRPSTAFSQPHPRNVRFLSIRLTAVAALALVIRLAFAAGATTAAQGNGGLDILPVDT